MAFYGGIDREGAIVKDRFSELVRHRMRMLRTQLRHSVVQVRRQDPTNLTPRHPSQLLDE